MRILSTWRARRPTKQLKMLKAKGLPPVVVPEDVFWMKITAKMGVATSRESVMTGISGFQEERLEEMVLGDEAIGGDETTMNGENPKEQRML